MTSPDSAPQEPEQDSGQDSGQPGSTGTLRPTTPRALTLCGVTGLVGGWAFPRLMVRWSGDRPLISWTQPLALLLVAAIMGFLAWHTWRTVQQLGRRLEVHHSVNRLVLARACALAGALVAGGYAGYAVSWLGDASQRADSWILRAGVAAVAAVGVMLTSLVLERACRAPRDGLQL